MKNETVLLKEKTTEHKSNFFLKIAIAALKAVIVPVLIIGFAIAGLAGGALYSFVTTAEPLNAESLIIKSGLTTFVYDKDLNVMSQLVGSENLNREILAYSQIPENLIHALVAIEDERFYKHNGVDFIRTIAAIGKYVTGAGDTHGGSTITQQLVKVVTGNDKQSPQRKVQEWWIAMSLEDDLEKWQIVTEYLNRIYMGNGCYGVQAASKTYFEKDCRDLNLAECAVIAGIINAPGTYDPFTTKGRIAAKERQELILDAMLTQGWIDMQEYKTAADAELAYAVPSDISTGLSIQSYFTDKVVNDVIADLVSKYDVSEDTAELMVYNNGLNIFTTQDPSIQTVMDEVFLKEEYFSYKNKMAGQYDEEPQAAMLIMDPYTGHVLAMYGGAGEKTGSRTFNRAVQLDRHPGSSIKPIAVYGPAIDLGLITPATVIDDIPVRMYSIYDGEDKLEELYPLNFETGIYFGLTDVRNALKNSRNVVAALIFRDILTPQNSVDYLKKVNLNRENEQYVSLALGGPADGMSPLEMAAAYSSFPNKGIYTEPITYTEVTDSEGKVLLEKKQNYNKVYSEATAYIMIDLMKEVTKSGGTAALNIGPSFTVADGEIPIAGKTGTAGDNRDKWFVGYTPYYVAASWYGYDNVTYPIAIDTGEESWIAQKMWREVMSKIHENLPAADFEKPATGIVTRTICKYSGKIASPLCYQDPRGDAVRTEYFIEGTEPAYNDLCDVHVKAQVCYASKDQWGRYLLAGPNCPSSTILERVYVQRKIPYYPVMPDDPYPEDWFYELQIAEYCTAHGGSSDLSAPEP
ncbi:MAG: transglycosylase domain-containing protein [Eubacteriales bacterium]|nr:transglycosylase domain-containing protein [Eubacteriales bacterium]